MKPTRGIFVSYRRDDASGQAGRLYERLAERYGADRVFMDVDTLRPGADFISRIEDALGASRVLLAIVGRDWLGRRSDGTRRIDDPHDFVRLEVAGALRLGLTVIPILVRGAETPAVEDLPEDVRPLVERHAIELDDARWSYDVGRLVLALDAEVGRPRRRRNVLAAAAAAGLAVLVGVLLLTRGGDGGADPPGGRLAFVSTDAGSSRVIEADANDGGATTEIDVAAGLRPKPAAICCLGWQPDGADLLFESYLGAGPAILLHEGSGSSVLVGPGFFPPTPGAELPLEMLGPAWSPDGSSVVFTVPEALMPAPPVLPGEEGDEIDTLVPFPSDGAGVYVLDMETLEVSHLTTEADSGSVWYDDRILFVRDGNTVMSISEDGSDEQVLVGPLAGAIVGLAVAEDGTLAFARDQGSGRHEIWVMKEGADPYNLTDDDADDRDPVFSPGGDWIAFASDREGSYDVYRIPADGGEVVRLSNTLAEECCLSWRG